MNESQKWMQWKHQKKAEKIRDALQSRSFDTELLETVNEARKRILELIPKGASVAVGGSVTLEEMDMVAALRSGHYLFFDRYQNLPFEKIVDIYRRSLTADYLITSVNAVTEKGELVLSDSSGNRVAGLAFGAKHVIVVVSSNKLVRDVDEAFERIREIEPMNCKRNHHHTISSETGFFTDEVSEQRMLNVSCIMHYGGKFPGRFKILVLRDEAGY